MTLTAARLYPVVWAELARPGSAIRHTINELEPWVASGQTGVMLITPRPGTNRRLLRELLGQVHLDVTNLAGGGGPGKAQDRVGVYLEWVTSAVQRLGNQISAADLDRLVLTPGYDRLLAVAGTMTSDDTGTQRVLNGMVRLELNQRAEALRRGSPGTAGADRALEHSRPVRGR